MTFLNPNWYEEITQYQGKLDIVSWNNNLALYSLCARCRWTQTLEIGIGQQPNGVYLLGHLAKKLGGRHTAIDPADYPIRRAGIVIEHYDLPVDLLEQRSEEVNWKRRMQMIYIDGLHTTEQVLADIANFAKWIMPNGLMIFDDYGKQHLGVTQAVDGAWHDYYRELFDMLVLPAQEWAIWRRRK